MDNPDYHRPQGDDEPDYSDDFSPRTENSIRKREAGLLPQSQTPCDRCGEYTKGPYIKDVRTEGGGGVGPKADIVREVAWIYSYRSSHNKCGQGGEGVQKLKNFADVLNGWPLKISTYWKCA